MVASLPVETTPPIESIRAALTSLNKISLVFGSSEMVFCSIFIENNFVNLITLIFHKNVFKLRHVESLGWVYNAGDT